MKISTCGFILVFGILCKVHKIDSEELNEYINHYDGLTYDRERVHNLHKRAKRSTDNDAAVHIKFNALGRNFHLRLKRDTGVFSKNLKLELSDGTVVDHVVSHMYDGFLKGEPNSHVHGSIIEGTFAGTIHTPKGKYYVEKVENYFKDSKPFHSVIYRENDINSDPHRLKRAIKVGSCGSTDQHTQRWMEDVQNSATGNKPATEKVEKREVKWEQLFKANSHSNMYSAYHNINKRATGADSSKRTCTLFLQSDPYLWKYMTDPKDKNGLGYDDGRASEEITSLFGLHVKGIKGIYESTYFEYDNMRYIGFSFVVRRIKIMKFEDCLNKVSGRSQFCEPHIDVTNFLNLNSLTNHNEYCLAYVFTYRDFTGGTLGLAWVGAPTRASGGICEQWKEYSENGKKIYKSLNTGIVTLVNYGSRVPPKVSTLTFAHEVGHNFGSPHDSGSSCTPFTTSFDEAGNFIMFASATSGERPNNSKFSPCSIGNMTLVVDAVLNKKNGKENCFKDSEEAYCGNNIVEEGEQCDCGFHEDCTDTCCYGRPENPTSSGGQMCTLKPNVQCSPSQGPCCFANCTYKSAGANCLAEQSCTTSTNCDGQKPQCPSPPHKPNDTFCNENTQICISGECQGSICSRVNWHQCYLTAPVDKKDYDKGNLCFVACENPVTKECVSSSPNEAALEKPDNAVFRKFLESEQSLGSEGIKLPPGAPCDNFQGYCDVFQKCRGVDADGPLARLKNLLFSEETLNTIKDWIIRNWWAVLLMAVGLVVIMGLFIHCCSVHTPSSNPNKAPARKITHTLSRRRNQGPPPGYPNTASGNRSHAQPPPSNNPPSSRPPPYNPYPPYNPNEQYEMKQGYPHGGRV